VADTRAQFFRGDTDRTFAVECVETPVELRLLFFGEWEGLALAAQAVP